MDMSNLRVAVMVLLVAALMIIPAVAQAATAPAPAFTLELFGGKNLSLADLKGTAVVLLFWANW
ncbi:MAG: peroxiredoxin family protein [Armatimonadota bacterium]